MAITEATAGNFRELIAEGFVLVDFYGTTCMPCKAFARILNDVSAEIPFLDIVKLNTTDNPELAEKYNIAAVPTVHCYRDGERVFEHLGVMNAAQIKAVLAEYMY